MLEDDVRFEPFFKKKLAQLMEEAAKYQSDWELM